MARLSAKPVTKGAVLSGQNVQPTIQDKLGPRGSRDPSITLRQVGLQCPSHARQLSCPGPVVNCHKFEFRFHKGFRNPVLSRDWAASSSMLFEFDDQPKFRRSIFNGSTGDQVWIEYSSNIQTPRTLVGPKLPGQTERNERPR